MRWRNTDFDIKALAGALDNARVRATATPAKGDANLSAMLASGQIKDPVNPFQGNGLFSKKTAGKDPQKFTPEQQKALKIWTIGALISVFLIIIAVNFFTNDTVVIYPNFSEQVLFDALKINAVVIWILMAIRIWKFRVRTH
jgi:hypothetical protein